MLDDLKKLRMNCVCTRHLSSTRCSYGDWEVTDEEVNCYIKQEKLDEKFKKDFNYYLFLNGRKCNETYDKYNLDKPFYYIFEDITFDKPVELRCDNGNIIFRNCVFTKGVTFDDVETVIFENNIYDNITDRDIDDRVYIVGKAKNVQFIDENFFAIHERDDKNFKFSVRANRLICNHSIFDSPLMDLSLKAKTMITENTKINVADARIKANKFVGVNDDFYANKEFNLIFKKYIFDSFFVDSPIVKWNGISFCGQQFGEKKLAKQKKLGAC